MPTDDADRHPIAAHRAHAIRNARSAQQRVLDRLGIRRPPRRDKDCRTKRMSERRRRVEGLRLDLGYRDARSMITLRLGHILAHRTTGAAGGPTARRSGSAAMRAPWRSAGSVEVRLPDVAVPPSAEVLLRDLSCSNRWCFSTGRRQCRGGALLGPAARCWSASHCGGDESKDRIDLVMPWVGAVSVGWLTQIERGAAVLVAKVGVGSVVQQPTDAVRSSVLGGEPQGLASEQLIDRDEGAL